MVPVIPSNATASFAVLNQTDVAYLYIGSMSNQSASTIISWEQYVAPKPMPAGKAAILLAASMSAMLFLFLYI